MSTGPAFLPRGRWQAAAVLALSAGLCGLPCTARGDAAGAPASTPSPDGKPAEKAPPLPAVSPPGGDALAPGATSAGQGGRPDALRDVDRRIGDLKDQIFRAKARLSLLSERHLRSSSGGVLTTVSQRNQLGRLYRLVRVVYEIDGREVFRRDEDSSQPIPTGDLPVWDGPLRPGEHTLSATLLYRGNGSRVFSYFDQYTYTVTAAHRFVVSEGVVPRIRVVCREKGNFATTGLENRPFIEFVADEAAAGQGVADKGANASR